MTSPAQRHQLFISYSRVDRAWVEKFLPWIQFLERNHDLHYWDDSKIPPGDKWHDEIQQALRVTKVALLLVSQDFLNSDYVARSELPQLLDAAEQDGLRILWVPVRHSLVDHTPISAYQAAINPDCPLEAMSSPEESKALKEIANVISAIFKEAREQEERQRQQEKAERLALEKAEAERKAEEERQAREKEEHERQEAERAAHEQNLQRYEQEFCDALDAQYPLETHVTDELKQLQQQLQLSDEDVTRIQDPLIAIKEAECAAREKAEAERNAEQERQEAERLAREEEERQRLEAERIDRERKEQELKAEEERQAREKEELERQEAERAAHDQNLQRYEQEFRYVLEAQYPIESHVTDQLKQLQQQLQLSDEDVTSIQEPMITTKEAERLAREKEALERQSERESQRGADDPEARTPALPEGVEPSHFGPLETATLRRAGSTWEIQRRLIDSWGFRERLAEGVELELMAIPAGSFQMGSPADEPERAGDEGPLHEVQLEGFFLARTPITQAQWLVVAGWGKVDRELDPDPSNFKGANRPVEQVSWFEAVEFCRRLSQRTGRRYGLPSEAQWEYACRAGTTEPFAFGETITTDLANYDGTFMLFLGRYNGGPKGVNRKQTTDVGSFPANPWGLHDLHGNVWEWCEDHWHDNYQGAPGNGHPWLIPAAGVDEKRLLRGGSWDSYPGFCRSAFRYGSLPVIRSGSVGFRVCCLPPGSPS